MKSAKMSTIVVLALGLIVCQAKVSEAAPMGTAFTYQGRLIDANDAADGLYDFEFKLFDDPCTGTQQGGPIDVNDLDVIDGYFTVELDFGSNVFNGDARWLEISVRPGDSSERDTILSPRQELTPTPYAIYAKTAGSDNDWMVSGNDMYSIPTGNVGIGTTSPTAPLSIKTTIGPDIEFTGGGINADIMSEADFKVGTSNSSPFYILTDNQYRLIVEATGNIGIGTTSPTARLHVKDTPSLGTSIFGEASSGTAVTGKAINSSLSTNYGGWFEAAGTWGRGIYGKATNTGDYINYGGYFMANGRQGRGVYGAASGTSGYGGHFTASGTSGMGIRAWSTGSRGYGGFFEATNSPNGRGVHGSGYEYGGFFSAAKFGVYGFGNDSGTGYGGFFTASGTSGRGACGSATNSGDVTNYGGYFKAQGTYGRGVYGVATGSSGVGIYGEATGGGKAGYFDGDVHTTGEITKAYTVGTSNPATPIAYAFIYSDGTVASGTPNVGCTWNAASSRYEINISGESYFWSNYVTVVTVTTSSAPRIATTGSVSDRLLVSIWDPAGSKVQEAFQFVTYKP